MATIIKEVLFPSPNSMFYPFVYSYLFTNLLIFNYSYKAFLVINLTLRLNTTFSSHQFARAGDETTMFICRK